MADLIVACVRAGPVFSLDHVRRLRDAVSLHLRRPYTMVCLTDQPERCELVSFIDISEMGMPEQWAKLLLFEPGWRTGYKIIYFDLDIDITGDITPLADVPGEFAIHEGVIVIGANMASYVWTSFDRKRDELLADPHGMSLRPLLLGAADLRHMLPKGFFREAAVPRRG
jgi:hypothetical protein